MQHRDPYRASPGDVGEHEDGEAELRRREALAQALLANVPGGAAFVIDGALRYRVAEGAALFSSGLRPQDLVGKTIFEALDPSLAASYASYLRQALEGTSFSYEHSSHGRWYYSRGLPLRGAGGAVEAVLVVSYDITERRHAEAALRASEAQLRLALDIAQLGTWTWKLATGAGDIDSRGAAIVGLSPGSLENVAEAQRQCIHPDDFAQLEADIAAGIASGEDFNLAYRVIHADGSLHYVASRARVLADEAGRPSQIVGTNRDVTGEREGELRLRASEARLLQLYAQEQAARAQAEEASRLKDEFLATVSHELRTPLTAFLGYAELLQRRRRDEAYVSRTIEKMVRSARTQAELIEDLLDISRIISGKLRIEPAPTELADAVNAALDTVRPTIEAKGLQLQVDLDPRASTVLGDANRLQQVVWNLLSNATKFTAPGGQIGVQLVRSGNIAELTVRDTGRGIHPDFLPYVFDRFRQADSSSQRAIGGLGLGLAIVRHLVELHGGTVEAASAGVEQGAAFVVRLPLALPRGQSAASRAALGEQAARARWYPLRGVRVVVVDDQPAILELLMEMLASEGAVVRASTSAREALALVRDWRPDVLVSDIAMPGEDGFWLIEQVRALATRAGGATPAVALTAYVRMEDRMRVLAAGFEQYVAKPVNADELCDAVLRGASRERQR